MSSRRSFGTFLMEALYYRTAKLVEIRNWRLGLLHRTLQVAILLYVIGYAIIWNQGYQSESKMVSSFSSKVKGTAWVHDGGSATVYDAYDLVLPPLEGDGLFVGLSIAKTKGQRQGICAGNFPPDGYKGVVDPQVSERCDSPYGCIAGRATWNGITAGECAFNSSFCSIYAWCPLEPPDLSLHSAAPKAIRNFTIFIKANVAFSDFGIVMDNVGVQEPRQFNASNPDDKSVSIWTVDDIVRLANQSTPNVNFNYTSLVAGGAVIAANFQYQCDFNYQSTLTHCQPTVVWTRIDDPTSASKGFNYRLAQNYIEDGEARRDLIKLTGLRFVFQTSGYGKKFVSPVPAVTQIGSGIAIIAIATVIADFLLEYVLPRKDRYKHAKIKDVDDPDIVQSVSTSTSLNNAAEETTALLSNH